MVQVLSDIPTRDIFSVPVTLTPLIYRDLGTLSLHPPPLPPHLSVYGANLWALVVKLIFRSKSRIFFYFSFQANKLFGLLPDPMVINDMRNEKLIFLLSLDTSSNIVSDRK